MTKCRHTLKTSGEDRPYFGCVAEHPYTECCPQAHGGTSYTQTCDGCGAVRTVVSNQSWSEVSTWSRDAAEVRA